MKGFQVYHWDTFDNETIPIGPRHRTVEGAEAFVKDRYGDRIQPDGADRVDIVNEDNRKVVRKYSVG